MKVLKGIEDQVKKTDNILSEDSKDGRAKNVRFSKEQLTSITPGDRAKAESSHPIVKNMAAICEAKMKELKEKRSHLFDSSNEVRPWKANELRFYDDSLKRVENCLKKLQKASSNIESNINVLKRRLSDDADQEKEQKRRKKRTGELLPELTRFSS